MELDRFPSSRATSLPDVRDLDAGQTVEREIADSHRHHYRIRIAADTAAELRLAQRGIDLVLELGAGGEPALDVDSPTGAWADEVVELAADETTSASYSIVVRPEKTDAGSGSYRISLSPERPATDESRLRMRLDLGYARSYGLVERVDPPASYDELLSAFEPLLDGYERLADPTGVLKVLIQTGRAYRGKGELDAAKEHLERGLAIARDLGSRQSEGTLHNLLGLVAYDRRDFERATRGFDLALALGQELEDPPIVMAALHNQAMVAYARGATEEALATYLELADIAGKAGDHEVVGRTLTEIGFIRLAFGDARGALEALDQASGLVRSSTTAEKKALLGLARGRAQWRLGDAAGARRDLEAALALWRHLGNPYLTATALSDLATLALGARDYDAAVRHFEEAAGLFRRLGLPVQEAVLLANLAQVIEESGDPEDAIVRYDAALELAGRVSSARFSRAHALWGSARAAARLGRLEEALRRSEAAVELIEGLRRDTFATTLKTTFFASKQDYFELFISLLTDRYLRDRDPAVAERLFRAIERARAQTLLDRLAADGVDLEQTLPPDLRQSLRDLADRIATAESILSHRKADPQAVASPASLEDQRRISRLAAEYLPRRIEAAVRLRHDIRRAEPRYGALTEPPVATLEAARRRLEAEDARLLLYALGRERSFALVVGTGDLHVAELADRGTIEALAHALRDALAHSDDPAQRAQARLAAARLADEIVTPVADYLTTERLWIVPDGALESVPFQVLPDAGPEARPSALLIDGHETTVAPSMSTLLQLRERRQRRPRAGGESRIVVISDPVHRVDDPRFELAPTSSSGLPEELRRLTELPRLTGVRAETRSILALAKASALELSGFQATLEQLRGGVLDGVGVVHFGTHAWFDPDDHRKTGLLLSLFDPRGRPRPGFLTVGALYELDLPVGLVVLGACQTGLGRQVRGEGQLSLARGFLHAGADAVLMSLWRVSDSATRILMERFYFHLLVEGRSAAAALRATQNDLRRQPAFTAPYFWAGFVLQGERGQRHRLRSDLAR